jgi:hypothetical protein
MGKHTKYYKKAGLTKIIQLHLSLIVITYYSSGDIGAA